MKDVGGGNSVNTAFYEDDGNLRESAKAFFKPGALVTVNGKQYVVKGIVTDDPSDPYALADYVQLTDVKTNATYNEYFGVRSVPPPKAPPEGGVVNPVMTTKPKYWKEADKFFKF
jgi:hypothetical protein